MGSVPSFMNGTWALMESQTTRLICIHGGSWRISVRNWALSSRLFKLPFPVRNLKEMSLGFRFLVNLGSGEWWVCVCVCVCAPLPPIARPPFHYLMIKRPSQWTKLARLLAHLASFSTIFFLTKSDMIFLNHVPVYQENSWASSWIWAARVRWRNDKLHPRPMAHAIIIAHCMRNLIQSLIAQHTTSAPPPRC